MPVNTPEIGPTVSIVMPCLNEEETVGVCVTKARGWLSASGVMGEVIDAMGHAAILPARAEGCGSSSAYVPTNARRRQTVVTPETETYDLGLKGTGRVRVVAVRWALLGWAPIPQRKGGPHVS